MKKVIFYFCGGLLFVVVIFLLQYLIHDKLFYLFVTLLLEKIFIILFVLLILIKGFYSGKMKRIDGFMFFLSPYIIIKELGLFGVILFFLLMQKVYSNIEKDIIGKEFLKYIFFLIILFLLGILIGIDFSKGLIPLFIFKAVLFMYFGYIFILYILYGDVQKYIGLDALKAYFFIISLMLIFYFLFKNKIFALGFGLLVGLGYIIVTFFVLIKEFRSSYGFLRFLSVFLILSGFFPLFYFLKYFVLQVNESKVHNN